MVPSWEDRVGSSRAPPERGSRARTFFLVATDAIHLTCAVNHTSVNHVPPQIHYDAMTIAIR
jgi:hypothetical protein